MNHPRVAPLPILALLLAVLSTASGQSVRSTHSGLLYFFDGYVFLGDEQVQQKFGRFTEIGEGSVLRTELGRAEVLLTPGVFLRVAENSAIRMLSNQLSDTRVELLRGSAIVEVSHEAVNPPDTLIYKGWQVRIPQDSVARLDSEPAQLRVLSGTAEVLTDGDSGIVTVQRGEVLPLASVLVAEQATTPAADAFNIWAMNRSSVVSEDNQIAAGITDDPDQIDTSGVASGGFSYFPQTGIASLGITYPYGLSFWSPDQSWFNPYLAAYPYGLLYRRVPAGPLLYPRPITIFPGNGAIGRPIAPFPPRPSIAPLPRIPIAPPHVAAPHPIHR
ncbi:MAG TPA: FecR family protein [Bryobacteraceae bacterium]|nr:FecR family protein [Bryobacteraceae bacterium]